MGRISRRQLIDVSKTVLDVPVGAEQHYHGAVIRSAKTGPRRELLLLIETWSKGKSHFGGGDIVTLRLGAISNYAEVERFFAKTPADELHYLRYAIKPKPGRHVVEMEFDRTGSYIKIIARSVGLSMADIPTARNDTSR